MKAYFDTAVLVAASVASHPHHTQAVAAVRAAANKKVAGYVSGHGLCELYAVLTRTPFNPPVHPMEAWKIISENVLAHFRVLTLSEGMYRAIIQECAERGWSGGRIYDALHVRCAKKAACERIYTFDLKHFCELEPDLGNRICAPQLVPSSCPALCGRCTPPSALARKSEDINSVDGRSGTARFAQSCSAQMLYSAHACSGNQSSHQCGRGIKATRLGGFQKCSFRMLSAKCGRCSSADLGAASLFHHLAGIGGTGNLGQSEGGIWTAVVPGFFIYPLTLLMLRLSGGRASLSPENPLGKLGMQIGFAGAAPLLLLVPVTELRLTLFYPALMVIMGAHYFPFTFLYGMQIFMPLAALTGCGVLIAFYSPGSFSLGGWIGGGILFVFAWIARIVARGESRG